MLYLLLRFGSCAIKTRLQCLQLRKAASAFTDQRIGLAE